MSLVDFLRTVRAPMHRSIVVAVFLPVPAVAAQKVSVCGQEKAKQAEMEADQLHNWKEMYLSFRRYSDCDDGAIAEGYSDSVAKLLADKWKTFDVLRRLVNKDPGFKKFVLRHIDETISQEQAAMIKRNASSRCPSNGRSFCAAMLAQLGKAR